MSRLRKMWYSLMVSLWPLGNVWKKLARMPMLDRTLGPLLWNERNLDATYIPVGEAVEIQPGSFIPYQVIADFTELASNRFILNRCLCRSAFKCRNYPQEIGCVFLGDAAAEIDTAFGRAVTAGEALAHVERARNQGLLPSMIHGSFDASLFGIDYRKMLAVCFCCNCCCAFRSDMRGGPVAYRDRIMRLPGLVMATEGGCSRCRACEDACFLGAIKLGVEGPEFAEFCKGCGRCADVCPRGNIRIRFEPDVDTRELFLRRIGARTDIG